jgi:hypothetical protein
MIKKEGWTRSYALSVLRSKFESEKQYQEVWYVNDLIKKEEEEESQKNTHQFQKDYWLMLILDTLRKLANNWLSSSSNQTHFSVNSQKNFLLLPR